MERIKNSLKSSGFRAIMAGAALLAVMLVIFLYVNSSVTKNSTGMDSFRKMFYILAALLMILTEVFYFLHSRLKVRLEYLFPAAALILGISYSIMVPVTSAPDESYHLSVAYAVAGDLMGWDTGERGTEMLRQDEAENGLSESGIAHEYYAGYFQRLTEKCSDDSLVTVPYSYNTEVPHVIYFPSACGINLGRVLDLGVVGTLMIGRFFNLIVFLLAGFYALKRIPAGKEILFAVMMLPMFIQEINSFSADSVILSLCLVFTAAVFRLGYRDRDRFSVLDLILMTVSCLLLAACKYGACMPLCLLLLLVVMKKWRTDRKMAVYSLALLAVSVVAVFLPSLYLTFSSSVLENAQTPYYTAGEVIGQPLHTLVILGNTINRYMDHYLYSAVGTSLGWYEINIPVHVGLLFLILLLVTLIPEKEEKGFLRGKEKIVPAVCCILGAAMAAGGMMIGHTPNTSSVIEGIQGRYFYPFLFPFLLLLRPVNLQVDGSGSIRRRVPALLLAVHFLAVMCLFYRAY